VLQHWLWSKGAQFTIDTVLKRSSPKVRVVGWPPAVQTTLLPFPHLLKHALLHKALVGGAEDLHATRLHFGHLATTSIAVVSDRVAVTVASPLVLAHRVRDVEDSVSAILWTGNRQRLGSFLFVILRFIGAKTVRIIIWTAVRILSPVAKSVAIAESAKYGHTTSVLPARAAVHSRVLCPAIVPRYVPVRMRPGWSPPSYLNGGDQGEEKEGEKQDIVGGEHFHQVVARFPRVSYIQMTTSSLSWFIPQLILFPLAEIAQSDFPSLHLEFFLQALDSQSIFSSRIQLTLSLEVHAPCSSQN